MRQRTTNRIKYAPHHPNPLTEGFPIAARVAREIAVNIAQAIQSEDGYRGLAQTTRHNHKGLLRAAR
jgi:hypothetical protein